SGWQPTTISLAWPCRLSTRTSRCRLAGSVRRSRPGPRAEAASASRRPCWPSSVSRTGVPGSVGVAGGGAGAARIDADGKNPAPRPPPRGGEGENPVLLPLSPWGRGPGGGVWSEVMSDNHLRQVLRPQLEDLRQRGLYKRERQLQGPQGAAIQVAGREVINFCANNYLGLANHPAIVGAAREGLDRYGYGLSSV